MTFVGPKCHITQGGLKTQKLTQNMKKTKIQRRPQRINEINGKAAPSYINRIAYKG